MSEWRKARKRPVVVEYWGPWDGTEEHARALAADYPMLTGWSIVISDKSRYLVMESNGQGIEVGKGDFIIRGRKGELYRRQPDVFAETYDHGLYCAGCGRALVGAYGDRTPGEPWVHADDQTPACTKPRK